MIHPNVLLEKKRVRKQEAGVKGLLPRQPNGDEYPEDGGGLLV